MAYLISTALVPNWIKKTHFEVPKIHYVTPQISRTYRKSTFLDLDEEIIVQAKNRNRKILDDILPKCLISTIYRGQIIKFTVPPKVPPYS